MPNQTVPAETRPGTFESWRNPRPPSGTRLRHASRLYHGEGFESRLTWSLPPHSPAERLAAGQNTPRAVSWPATTTLLRLWRPGRAYP